MVVGTRRLTAKKNDGEEGEGQEEEEEAEEMRLIQVTDDNRQFNLYRNSNLVSGEILREDFTSRC
jgi:hypothetical protein